MDGVVKEIKGKEFRRFQLIQLDILKEVDRVCRENNIRYSIGCGTLLGAVRHKGFIPWDDDIDVYMLREDYEKFKLYSNRLNPDICWFQDHTTDKEYLWGYGKVRRTGTTYVRVGQEHLKHGTGVAIDIFPLDDEPNSKLGRRWQDFRCFVWRKMLWAHVAKKNSKGLKKVWWSFLSKFSVEKIYKKLNRYIKKSSNSTPNDVRILMLPLPSHNPAKTRYYFPKKWIFDLTEYTFEGSLFYGMRDYDSYLKYNFKGDYMQLPPEDERLGHVPASDYDFGNLYEDFKD